MKASQSAVVEANRQYHNRIVESYESITHAGYDHYEARVARRVDEMVHQLGDVSGKVALDIGAGTGFFTKYLLKAGFSVVAVEVSSGMAKELRRRHADSDKLTVVESDISSVFANSHEQYSVISFVSVLHHLYDYVDVVGLAAARVEPGGFLYTVCDLVASDRPVVSRIVNTFDKAAYYALRPATVLRRLRRGVSAPSPIAEEFELAEFHARTGINVEQMSSAIQAHGLSPICINKNSGCKLGIFRMVESVLKSGVDLEMMWRRPLS